MKNKLLFTTVAGLTATCGLIYGATDYLFRVATDRIVPPSFDRFSKTLEGLSKDEDPYAFLAPGRERLRTAPHETVQTVADDGVKLVGHWFERENAERVIIAFHGWRSAWYSDFGASFDFFKDHHCSVLYVEQRGQGNSGGDYIGFGLAEHRDILPWVRWASERCGYEIPVYISGISMGATTVLMAADRDFPSNVKGIMADCGFTSPDAIWKHVARHNLHLPYLLVGFFANQMCKRRFGVNATRSTVDALKKCKLPVLLVHGEADAFVPVEMTLENAAACASSVRVLTVPNAIHGLSYIVDQKRYEDAEVKFWEDYDRSGSTP